MMCTDELLNRTLVVVGPQHATACGHARSRSLLLYQQSRLMASLARFWGLVTRRVASLPCLSRSGVSLSEQDARFVGHQIVPLAQIQGTEQRCRDFDAEFRPLQEHTRERWLRVAMVYEAGRALPPVDLVQVGEVYYVRDGHHRVSVARALGQTFIDATVVRVGEGAERITT
jgi:hypothetical protein